MNINVLPTDVLESLMLSLRYIDAKDLKVSQSLTEHIDKIENKQSYWKQRLEVETNRLLENWNVDWHYIYQHFTIPFLNHGLETAIRSLLIDVTNRDDKPNELKMILAEFSDLVADVYELLEILYNNFMRQSLVNLKLLLDHWPTAPIHSLYIIAANKGKQEVIKFILDNYSDRIPLDYLPNKWSTAKIILDSGKFSDKKLSIKRLLHSTSSETLKNIFLHSSFDLAKHSNDILGNLGNQKRHWPLILVVLDDPRVSSPSQFILQRLLKAIIFRKTHDSLDVLRSIIEHPKIDITPFQDQLLIAAAKANKTDVVFYLYNELDIRDPTGVALGHAINKNNKAVENLLSR